MCSSDLHRWLQHCPSWRHRHLHRLHSGGIRDAANSFAHPLTESANNFDGSESASSESAGSDLNFCYVAGVGSDSQPQSDHPESILLALQEDAISDAGSRSTTKVNIDSDSEEDSASMFEQQVKMCFNTPPLGNSDGGTFSKGYL